jgi:diguanylate cyclase (GGDEF)-like protein/PAS domain S-box-containing protein
MTRILLVEDNPGDARLIEEMLAESGNGAYTLEHEDRLKGALMRMQNGCFDLVLLDLNLPDAPGLQGVRRTCAAAPNLPIIILTGMEDEDLGLKALHHGAEDYLPKGNLDGTTLQRALRYALERKKAEGDMRLMGKVFESTREGIIVTDVDANIIKVNKAFTDVTGYEAEEVEGMNPSLLKSGRHGADFYRRMWRELIATGVWRGEIWNRRKDGEVYPEWLTINAIRDRGGSTTHYVGVFTDITPIKERELHLRHLATHDPLTNLANRELLFDFLSQAIARAKRSQEYFAVAVIDLNNFKQVNDQLGHLVGDELLCCLADRLRSSFREVDTIARLGGDEFAILFEGLSEPAASLVAVEKLVDVFEKPFRLKDHSISIDAGIGLSLYPVHGASVEELIDRADGAMYASKEDNDPYRYFSRWEIK